MQKVNSLVCVLGLLCVCAYARSEDTTTLNQAIETAKQRKTAELSLNASAHGRPQAGVVPGSTAKERVVKPMPKLWSIQGVGHALTAEVMYDGRIYELSFTNDAIRVGDWLLESLTAKEVVLTQAKYFGKTERSTRHEIRLQVPRAAQAAQLFPATTATESDAQGNVTSAGRPPVPFELLRP